MMKTFLAQKYNAFISTLCKTAIPFFLRKNNLQIQVNQECLDELVKLKNSSVVILFNHSDRFDPLAVAELSRIAGEDFGYIASREQFDGNFGLQGWLMQRCGAYSVLRGDPEDRESKEATIGYINDSNRKLVEFPEGDVTGRDDTILPLKQDGIRNILEAQHRQLKNGLEEPVFLLPVGIYYEVQKDGVRAMEDCLNRLESHLDILKSDLPIATRIQRVVTALIFSLEKTHWVQSVGSRLDHRLLSICAQLADRVANANGLPIHQVSSLHPSDLERLFHRVSAEKAAEEIMVYLHSVRNQLWRNMKKDSEISLSTDKKAYEKKLLKGLAGQQQSFFHELDKLEQLLILAHSLQQELATLNHAWRVIDRLEQEVLGKTTLKGHRIAYIESGPVINLLQFMPAYRGSEDGAIAIVDKSVRKQILNAINQLKSKHAVA